MAWTTLKTWAVGDVLTAADMNTYVRDNPYAVPFCILELSASHSFVSGQTLVPWDSAPHDTDGMADTANNRITIATAGYYRIRASYNWADTSAGQYCGGLLKVNGTALTGFAVKPTANTGFQGTVQAVEAYAQLAAGDHVTCDAEQNTGANLLLIAGNDTYLLAEAVTIP